MGLFSKTAKETTPPFDINQMEDAIREFVPRRHKQQHPRNLDEPTGATAPPARPVLLEQPQVTAEDIGRITADAIKADHEALAKAHESLSQEEGELMLSIEALKLRVQQQIADRKELAEQHREEGKLMSAQVASASARLAESRDQIEAMRKKIKE